MSMNFRSDSTCKFVEGKNRSEVIFVAQSCINAKLSMH